jgi:tRNA(adenine34) deaminase
MPMPARGAPQILPQPFQKRHPILLACPFTPDPLRTAKGGREFFWPPAEPDGWLTAGKDPQSCGTGDPFALGSDAMPDPTLLDREMMVRAIALARASGAAGEYPYGAVVARDGKVVAESTNRVAADADVTRHAEVVAISAAQKALGTVSLDGCTLYVNAEPCAFCSYAIRESRLARVVYGLSSPHMGGVLKWPVMTDEDISRTIPEVFAPPPEIVAGFMAEESEAAIRGWSPLAARVLERRGLFVARRGAVLVKGRRDGIAQRAMGLLRRAVFDRFGRR